MRRLSLVYLCAAAVWAEPPQNNAGIAGTVDVSVLDPTGASVAGATVRVENRAARFERSVQTGASGTAHFTNVPFNQYHVEVEAAGFQLQARDAAVRSTLPVAVQFRLELAAERASVDVHSDLNDAVESVPAAHVDLDRELLAKLPRATPAGGLSDAITLSAPGVVADSNGFFHPLGDHAETGFSIDNQPVTDQQSKQFTNQLPMNAIGSLEVTSGAAPAEFGDKASMVVTAITRSGLGSPKAFGNLTLSYGSFGTPTENFAAGWGGQKWGNFVVANMTRSGRYLDSPEFAPMHDVGNNVQFFDRLDWNPSQRDSTHLNLFAGRSWFQIPNTSDQAAAGQDQRQLVRSLNVAPGWVHLLGPTAVFTLTPFYRQDEVRYYPSRDPFADSPATVGQGRRLQNYGFKGDLAYVRGAHNVKAGVQYTGYGLNETFHLGVSDPLFNAPCANDLTPVEAPGIRDPRQCRTAGFDANPVYSPGLAPFDLTRGGGLFQFHGDADINQVALFAQDSITFGGFTAQAGLRADFYRGISSGNSLQPRLGFSYLFKPSSTVIRGSYARFFETPYNENLVLSSTTGAGGLATNVLGAHGSRPIQPGRRNQFNAGIQQGLSKHLMFDADYFWKFTDNAFDFDTLFNTPIQFPIEWRKSKIDGFSARLNLAPVHGLSAYTTFGHTRARFFGPENGGIIFNSPIEATVFRIDHDQAFQQTTHVRYQHGKDGAWMSFTWRFDSGMAVGAIDSREAALALTPAERSTIGLVCGSDPGRPHSPGGDCPPATPISSKLVDIPTGAIDADHNPARVAPRNLFDLALGTDNLFRKKDGARWTLQLSVINLTNEVALYNFLSTFSGTHFVSPRSYRVEFGFAF